MFKNKNYVGLKMELTREYFRAIIRRGLSQDKCRSELVSIYDVEAMSQTTIYRWYAEFRRGRVSLSTVSSAGRPRTAVTPENIAAVRTIILDDRHVTYEQIRAVVSIGMTAIQSILHNELCVRKLVSRWVPHNLSEEQKAARVDWCRNTLNASTEGSQMPFIISSQVTNHGFIHTNLKESISQQFGWYITVCSPEMIAELRKKNPKRRIVLHHDNASSHTARKTNHFLKQESVELMSHPPYSPDPSPNDFFTFPRMKDLLRDQRFEDPEAAVEAYKSAILSTSTSDWNYCFNDWFARIEKCIKLNGEYFEKQ
ncbi:unnamed protein product [Parnassius mnemosyne]|uniref:Transposase n=1 Tax=Parnassius mnemosyne TaxID=213953 RepID=A0AAV1L405_9NEOP